MNLAKLFWEYVQILFLNGQKEKAAKCPKFSKIFPTVSHQAALLAPTA